MFRKTLADVAKQARILQSQATSTSGCTTGVTENYINQFSRVKGWRSASAVSTQETRPSQTRLFVAPPASLASGRTIAEPYEGVEQNVFTRTLLRIGGFYSKESKNLRAAKAWYGCVTDQADDTSLLGVFGLEDNFADRYAFLCLHMWLCLVRLRSEGKDGKVLAQIIHENFQEDVELRVRGAGVKVRLSKHLMDLEQMFYGSCLSYDKAQQGGKEDLSAALIRNVYGGNQGKQKSADILARYLRRELACLGLTDSDSVMSGAVTFS